MTDKAKRRLTDIKFEHEGGHVALVGKHQGGGANGYTTLVFKATNDVPEEIVEKATKVSVTMDFEEFLVKWFNMYYEDAEVLAKLLGMEKEEPLNRFISKMPKGRFEAAHGPALRVLVQALG